jgi:hypothetical protein
MATKDDVINMDCDELKHYLKNKFNFSDEVLQQFKGMY